MENEMLRAIKEEVWGGAAYKDVTVGTRVYRLKTINDGEAVWRDKFVVTTASFSFLTSKKAPTIAVSLVSIDGVPVRELFLSKEELKKGDSSQQDEDTVKVWLKLIGFGSSDERYRVAQRVYDFLSSLPTPVIDALYQGYLDLEAEQTAFLREFLKKK